MNNRFEPARLSEWLYSVATTEDDEVDCDALAEAAERVFAAGMRGEELRAVLPEFALHLDHCPDCRDWYDTLLALSRDESAS